MKKILVIFTGAMELGGIERSLLGLLDAIDYKEYQVDLFLYAHHGPLYPLINKNVNILPEVKELAYLRESFATKIRNGCYYSAWMRLRDEFLGRFKSVDHDATWAQIMHNCAPYLKQHYDIALSFFRPFDFISEKVDASIKVGWIHTDYTTEKTDNDSLKNDYEKVDFIAAVSDQCAETFQSLFPSLAGRITVIENILSKEFVYNEAEKIDVSSEMPEDGSVKILSIGRFTPQKNFDNVPTICRKIREIGIDVKWYIIGFGPDEEIIRQRISETGMQDHVIILGKKENPYPYIKACNLYAQPSRYEGKAVTVREAQMLGKPVVITRYATSGSQLEEGIDGWITPLDNEECAWGIADLLNHSDALKRIADNCKGRDYTNQEEVKKIYQMIEKKRK